MLKPSATSSTWWKRPIGISGRPNDENQEELHFERHSDVVGIAAMTQQAIRAYAIADEFRTLQHADTVFIGEAEDRRPMFIEELGAGKAHTVYDQGNRSTVRNAAILHKYFSPEELEADLQRVNQGVYNSRATEGALSASGEFAGSW